MADDRERLILEMSADLKRFEKGLARATSVGEKRLSQLERRFEKSGKKMARSMGGAATNINRAIAGIATAAAIREVGQYADAWTAAKNKLAAAGVPMAEVNGRQRELVRLANETRSGLTATVDLYAKLTRATEALGATQTQVARATETVNKGFKAGGAASSEQASGILQLGQALSSGLLQGDELRSLRENAPLIAQAIAAEFQTTIGGLKQLGAEGKLTADRVFGAILAGSAAIDAQFARTTPTIADSFTILRNEATQFIGELDRATGASATLAAFITHVSENLDVLVAAAVIAATVLGGVLAGNAVVALIAGLAKTATGLGITSAAMSAMGARATLAAGGVNALKAALAFFGGPIGLAVTAVAIAFGLLAANAAKARLEAQQMADALDQQAAAANMAAEETSTLAGEITATQTWAAGLTGQTHLLADAHYRAAAGAKAQAIEEARLRLATANETLGTARERLRDRRTSEGFRGLADYGRNPALAIAGLVTGQYSGGAADRRTRQSQEFADLRRSTAIVVAETRNLRDLMGASLDSPRFAPPTFRNAAPPASTSGGAKGPSAEELERKARAEREQLAAIAAANAIQIAQFRRETDAVAILERQEMIRERVNALISAGLTETEAQQAATVDQAAYDAARADSIARVVSERQAELALTIATLNEDIEQVRELTAKAELASLVAQYQEDGLSLAEATTKALADHVRLEEARINARVRFMAEASADHRQRVADLQGETLLAERLARAREVETRSRRYRDEGGMSGPDAESRARSEVMAETRASAQGAFRDAFRNGVLEAVRSGDLVAAAGEFALNASQVLTDKVLNSAADALFDVLANQFPNLFDLGQELAAESAGAATMATAITTAAATGAAAIGTGVVTGATTGAGIMSASLSAGAVPAAAIMGAAIAAAGAQAAAAMAAAIAASGGGGTGNVASVIASAFAGARAGGGPVRYHMRNEKGPEPFVPTSAGVIFSNQAMRGLASLGNLASQGGGMGGDVNVEVVNATGVPATVTQERTANGGTKLTLEPMFEKGLEGAGRSGALKRAARLSPTTTKRG